MSVVHIVLGSPDKQNVLPEKNLKDIYVGVDRGGLFLVEKGYTPDLVLGDFDSITKEEKSLIEHKAKKVIPFKPEKDDTDAELSLVYAEKLFNVEKIYLYGWAGGRIDHLMSTLMIPLQPRFEQLVSNLIFVDQTNSIHFYSSGEYSVQKEADKQYCSIIGLTPIEEMTIGNGFKYTVSDTNYDYPIALISNEFIEPHAYFSFKKGLVAFVQSRDNTL
ncbi:thiamine diphosphokinase [Marinilactibacillus sp. Marseille-P9653]|uniref:thiamine diphosphokinase n=1 Tax=Marinilactibacillus sp. Marseille-P9653 TaxID=2866583 RepID=UPI001CE3F331|nr:thiamine diphosphokinase [Marinilactibacillus sp. Marseille-P9653]